MAIVMSRMRECEAILIKRLIMEDEKKQKFLLEKHKDIARIDQESKRTHGWYVRVRFVGKTHSKFFSDRKCGGRYSSLLSAISWRDKTEKKLGKIRTNKHMVTVSNSGTGVVGVRLNEKLNRFEVSWVTHQGKQGKNLSINYQTREKECSGQGNCHTSRKRKGPS